MTLALLLVSVLAASALTAEGCNIKDAENNAFEPRPGGWHRAELNSTDVLALKLKAVEADNSVDRGVHVTEAYSQVVAGTNFCIRFSAAGRCSGGLCQVYECVAAGFKALGSQVVSRTVNCTQMQTCNMIEIREYAKHQAPGGWFSQSSDQETVSLLHERASELVSTRKGRVLEAYDQVVAGMNYCIRFESDGLQECNGDSCLPVTCVAGGYDPLTLHGYKGPLRHISVHCDRVVRSSGKELGSSSPSGAGKLMGSMTSPMITSLLAIFSAILLH
jgi:hypothetical protein